MDNYKIIQSVIKRQPDVLNNRQRLKSVLLDYFPSDKLTVNMFLMAYDVGMLSAIEKSDAIDEFMFRNFINNLTSDYGVTNVTARNIVKLSASTLNKAFYEPPLSEVNAKNDSPSTDRESLAKPKRSKVSSSAKDFRYASNGKEVRINKYIGNGGKVVIPDYIDGLPVTRIAENAFYAYGSKGAELITEVYLPSQLKYIGDGAFQNIEKLTGVLILPPTLEEVDYHAFQCTNLTGLVVQSSCYLKLNSFANIDGMKFVFVAEGCAPIIDDSVFSYAEALKDLILPREISDIADETFYACNDAVMYAPQGSYAAEYGRKNFINVSTEQYEQMSAYYKKRFQNIK